MEVNGQHHALADFTSEKNLCTHLIGSLGHRTSLGTFREKNLLPVPGFEPRIVQSVAWSRYRLNYTGVVVTVIPPDVTFKTTLFPYTAFSYSM